MSQLMRVSIQGTMPGGEVWSVNPVYRLGTGLDVPVDDADMLAILTAINGISIPTGLTFAMSSTTTITGTRIEARMADGELQNLAEGARTTPVAGSGAGNLPYQTSLVSSLRSSAFGARGRGRLYWPGTGLVLQSANLRPSSGNIDTILGGVKVFLAGIETAIETSLGGASLAVWSRTNATLSAVQSIQIGDVADVQRRRRDALVESYTSIAYP